MTDSIIQLLIQGGVLLAAIVGAFLKLTSDVRSVREAQAVTAADVTEIKGDIKNAGYMSKGDVDRLLNDANEAHRRYDETLRALQKDKLDVVDYVREKAVTDARIEAMQASLVSRSRRR